MFLNRIVRREFDLCGRYGYRRIKSPRYLRCYPPTANECRDKSFPMWIFQPSISERPRQDVQLIDFEVEHDLKDSKHDLSSVNSALAKLLTKELNPEKPPFNDFPALCHKPKAVTVESDLNNSPSLVEEKAFRISSPDVDIEQNFKIWDGQGNYSAYRYSTAENSKGKTGKTENHRNVHIESTKFSAHLLSKANAPISKSLPTPHPGYHHHPLSSDDGDTMSVDYEIVHRAYIALGSNVGYLISMIESACREMDRRGINVIRTSALYETEAMYLSDQPSFINGVCEVRTTLDPLALLDNLKEIEMALGRQKTVRNGPRSIDLDILLYENETINHERLSIPHPRISEREFVLRPLCDLIPNASLPPPLVSPSFQVLLDKLPTSPSPLSPLTPLSPNLPPISSLAPSRTSHIMGILNLSPDSFSDGGLHATDPSSLLPTLQTFLSAGVSIVDIGGQSTRPHAPQISAEEELSRILPTINHIRSLPSFDKMAISIDTYRASVASAAISAGASIVNDVSAGQMDPEMLSTVAKLGCTVILMHMRGTPETMTKLTHYPTGVLNGVASELVSRVGEAEKAGIRRWRIMLDPGIGFAKTDAQNLELLRRFAELRGHGALRGFPWVVGSSRKGFIGRITGVKEPRARGWGTAATVSAAVMGGADVCRVHDAVEMKQVVKMADAIWRV